METTANRPEAVRGGPEVPGALKTPSVYVPAGEVLSLCFVRGRRSTRGTTTS